MSEDKKDKVVKFRPPPEPIEYNGRERYLGWNTAAVGNWLIKKKLGPHFASTSEIAGTFYPRDGEGSRAKVRRNTSPLRRWLADRNEFLLVRYTKTGMISELKVCNPADEYDRRMAMEQLLKLVDKEEITHSERTRWEQLLFLPASFPVEGSGAEQRA